MNRAYVISHDGRIFFADSNSETFELLEANYKLKFKKLVSCDWGLWAISTSFEIYLFVFKTDTPIDYQEVTYENQVIVFFHLKLIDFIKF